MSDELMHLPKTAGDLELGGARFTRYLADPYAEGYVAVDDTLCWRVLSTVAGVTVNLSLRYQGINGEIRPEFYTEVTTVSGGVAFVRLIPGSEGWLLSATIEAPGSLRGQVFVSLDIQRGLGAQDVTFGQQLIAGYPGSNNRIGYPQCPPASPLDGRGAMRSIAVGAPGAGVDFTQTVPAGSNWILRSASAQLLTSATVATREVSLQVVDGAGNVLFRSPADLTQVASLTQFYSWFNGAISSAGVPNVAGGIPAEFRLLAGWKVQSLTANIQAADQFSLVVLGVEEYVAA